MRAAAVGKKLFLWHKTLVLSDCDVPPEESFWEGSACLRVLEEMAGCVNDAEDGLSDGGSESQEVG